MNERPRLVSALVAACFFVSGAAGLVYQTVWARYLGLFLGHSSYAVVAVLMAFMGGLAIGNAWLGPKADQTRRPLALYACLEIAIGLYALIFPHYYTFCHDAFIALARRLGPGSGLLLAAKFAFSLATILIPTALMGATFPALTRFVTRSLAELRERVAALYCLNSAGAIAGCVLGDFWLVPSLGLETAVLAAAALNLVAGLVALVLSKRLLEGEADEPLSAPAATVPEESYTPAELKLAVIAVGVSGFVAMLYEVVWTRLLALVLGSSTHAFSLMLITFISGITAGSWLVYRWKNLRRTFDAFGWAELALGVVLAISMFFYDLLPYWFVKIASVFARREENYPIYALVQLGICFLVMFPPTVCLGMTLPLISRIATSELARSGRSVGRVFAVNTLGTVLGAALSGLVLLPMLGLARTLGLGVGLNVCLALAVLRRQYLPFTPRVLAGGVGGVALVVLLAGGFFNASWSRSFTLGLWRTPAADLTAKNFAAWRNTPGQVFYRDGAQATVSVHSQFDGTRTNLSLQVNGKTDASSGLDMGTQMLLGHVPLHLKPAAKDVLVIGLGSGVTVGSVALHPGLNQVDVVEISPEVAQAARFFADYNHGALDNPKVKLTIEDAKTYLLAGERAYDVIISEPSNPWMAGVAAVFSQEFYNSCRARLRPDGLMVQWLQAYESNDAAFNMVLATFASVFPHVSIWEGRTSDMMLVGSSQPIPVDLDAMSRRFAEPAIKADCRRIGLTSFPLFLAHEVISTETGAYLPPLDATIHTDFYPSLEFLSQKAFFVRAPAESWQLHDERYGRRSGLLLARYLEKHQLVADDYWAFLDYFPVPHLTPNRMLRSLFLHWRQVAPESAEPLGLLNRVRDLPSAAELYTLRFAGDLDQMIKLASRTVEPLQNHTRSLMEVYRYERGVFHLPSTETLGTALNVLLALDPAHERTYRLFQAELAWDKGDDDECMRLGKTAFDPDTTKYGPTDFSLDPAGPALVLTKMVGILARRGELMEAGQLCQAATDRGFLGPKATTPVPALEVAHRKILAQIERQMTKAAPAVKR